MVVVFVGGDGVVMVWFGMSFFVLCFFSFFFSFFFGKWYECDELRYV
jgi:hypothetical protein